VSDLVFTGTLARHPGIPWIFTHGGGVLPLLAERLELFRTAFTGEATGPAVPEQVRDLWFDLAGTPFPLSSPRVRPGASSRHTTAPGSPPAGSGDDLPVTSRQRVLSAMAVRWCTDRVLP
jgi:hypothetical protein